MGESLQTGLEPRDRIIQIERSILGEQMLKGLNAH